MYFLKPSTIIIGINIYVISTINKKSGCRQILKIKKVEEKKSKVRGVDDVEPVRWNKVNHRRVVRNGLFREESEYSNYLFFEVSTRFDNLLPEQNPSRYSEKQLETYRLIKSLHDRGLSYRRITKYLNNKGVLTHKGHQWGETGNSVYSVLKRFAQRQERLKSKNQRYPIIRSKMWVEFTK